MGNGILDSTPAGDDVVFFYDTLGADIIHDGADRTCGTPATGPPIGDDIQGRYSDTPRSLGNIQPIDLVGHDDWSNLAYNLRNNAQGDLEQEEPELTAEEAQVIESFWEQHLNEIYNNRNFTYSVKFVCVPEVGQADGAVIPQDYRTVVNVHNSHSSNVTFAKKAVIAQSEDEPRGNISQFVQDSLGPD
ncbi:MAG: hypothetical protein WBX01_10695 [Nitrososphaeraceae archaeon]